MTAQIGLVDRLDIKDDIAFKKTSQKTKAYLLLQPHLAR